MFWVLKRTVLKLWSVCVCGGGGGGTDACLRLHPPSLKLEFSLALTVCELRGINFIVSL